MSNKSSNRFPMPTANKTAALVCLVFGTTTYASLAAYSVHRNGVSVPLAFIVLMALPGFVCVWAKHFGWERKKTPPKPETHRYLNTWTAEDQLEVQTPVEPASSKGNGPSLNLTGPFCF